QAGRLCPMPAICDASTATSLRRTTGKCRRRTATPPALPALPTAIQILAPQDPSAHADHQDGGNHSKPPLLTTRAVLRGRPGDQCAATAGLARVVAKSAATRGKSLS